MFADGWYASKKKCLFKGCLWITKGLSASLPLTTPQAELCVLCLLILSFQISSKCQHTVCPETRAVTHNLPFWFDWPILGKAKAYIINTGIFCAPVSCIGLALETLKMKIQKKRERVRPMINIYSVQKLRIHNEGVVVYLIITMIMLSKIQLSYSESLQRTREKIFVKLCIIQCF